MEVATNMTLVMSNQIVVGNKQERTLGRALCSNQGVCKCTLSKFFKSKGDLIFIVLESRCMLDAHYPNFLSLKGA
jgi:hypothetical protein